MESTEESSGNILDEKYKATKLWNDLIRTFRSQMPVKPHRKNLKLYENTFTGSEAVDWLHGYLCAKAELPTKVTRRQTLILLQKFYQKQLFSEIVVKSDKFLSPSAVVKDDGSLFKFNPLSPTKIARTPLALKNLKNSCSREKLDDEDFVVKPLSYRKLSENETEKNNLAVSKESVSSSTFDFMKTFDNSKMCLYTRRLNSEEIENLWKSTSIARLQQILNWDSLNFVVEQNSINAKIIYYNAHNFTTRGVTKVLSKRDDLPHWTLQAMKCLANWPWRNESFNWPAYANFERDVLTTIIDFYNSNGSPLIPNEFRELFVRVLDRVEVLDVNEWENFNGCYSSIDEEETKIETEFGISKENSPISTKINKEINSNFETFLEKPKCRASYAQNLTRDVGSLEEILDTFPGLIKSPKLLNSLKNTPMFNEQNQEPTTSKSEPLHNFWWIPPQSRFSVASVANNNDISLSYVGGGPILVGSTLSFFTQKGRQTACEAMQLCLLFLPARNRRWLQLLLRMMNKIATNHCLRLDKSTSLPNRSLVIEAFADCLFVRGQTYSRKQSIKLLTFLMDGQTELFESPKCLDDLVKCRIENAEKEKICFTAGSTESITYCEQISPHIYESQTLTGSRQALLELLDNIIRDTNVSAMEKKKRLKKFQKAYPDLFMQRFPNKASFRAMFPSQDGMTKLNNALGRLKSLRM